MFVVDADRDRGIAVVLLAAPGSDADWLAYADTIDALNREAPRGRRPVLLQIIRPGMSMPSAIVRKRLAELRATIRADAINVVVSTSPMLRAAQTALDWLRKPHYESSSQRDLESALLHVEGLLGHPAPELRALSARVSRAPTGR